MLTSFFSGLSGLNSNSSYISVIGNNLANVNTIGFKSDSVSFADILHSNLGTNGAGSPFQIGMGSKVSDISPSFIQGGLQATGVGTHVAIEGRGFLIVDNSTGRYFTRAGNLSIDANGQLLTPDGSFVQGYTTVDAQGNVVPSGALTNINIPLGQILSPTAATSFNVITNLDATAAATDTFTSSLVIYDSLGAPHALDVLFTNTGAGAWNYSVQVDGSQITGGTAGTPVVLDTGTLAFDGTGSLNPTTGVNGGAPADVAIAMGANQWANGASQNALSWDIVNADGTFNLTGFASPSATSSTVQNGIGAAPINSILIDGNGVVQGLLNNGQQIQLAQLAMAKFNNAEGLLRSGNNLFSETTGSGQPSIGVAQTGGRGRLSGGAVELSNVDIAEEFVKLITAQRGYQASSRIITTTDEITQEAINLKR